MNATKTTLCMLLSAAIGSGVSATFSKDYHRQKFAREILDTPIREVYIPPGAIIPPSTLHKPAPIPLDETICNRQEMAYDSLVQIAGEDRYLRSRIDGMDIDFTTYAARRIFINAASNMRVTAQDGTIPTLKENIGIIIQYAQTQGAGPKRASDGTPLINYQQAVWLAAELDHKMPNGV